jgi:hypothetical protein
MPPEEIAKLQQRLVDAGLMDPDSYYAGVWTGAEAGAMLEAMGISNVSGKTVDATIDYLIANLPESTKDQRRRAAALKIYQAAPFITPDPASLTQTVKVAMRGELGREPTTEDYRLLTSGLSQAAFEDYQAQEAYNRAVFDANLAVGETGAPVPVGSVPDVDPVARFREAFDQRFGPEKAFIEGQADNLRNMDNVFASLRTMGNLIR